MTIGPTTLDQIPERWTRLRDRVTAAARTVDRDPEDVRILVATKTQPSEAIRAVVAAGAGLLGENRVQELTTKAPDLADLGSRHEVEVHLLGTLQRNKVNAVLRAGVVSCVQSVDDASLAEALSRRCEAAGRVMRALVQVNVSGEATKSGIAPSGAVELAHRVAALPGLELAGFMTIGARSDDEALVRGGFARLRMIRDRVVGGGAPGTSRATELSMGMSSDLEWAVAEGATLVRVGSAVFGPRG